MLQPARKGESIISGALTLWSCLVPLWNWAVKIFLHLVTRKSELERILSMRPFTVDMQKAFTKSLRASRQLAGVKRQVLGEFEFDVTAAASTIASVKKMSTSSGKFRHFVLPNLMQCLEGINRTNAVIRSCVRLSQTPYNSNDAKHEHMLEKLWGDLKPGVQRVGGRLTKEWGDIGFQGVDPASDFRGMGLLGLVQMAYFAQTRPQTARLIVSSADLPYKGIPYAITGINISNLVLDLLTERRFTDSFDAHLDTAMNQLHNVYCDVYCLFNHWWNAANPSSIMEFTAVFGRFHAQLARHLDLTGTVPPASWVDLARSQ